MTEAAMIEERRMLVRQAFFLEYVTLTWMIVEAGVAISADVAARSITLLAFFFDLNRSPIVCPKCAALFQVVVIARLPPRRATIRWG